MKTLISLLLTLSTVANAGLPPTSIKGQAETSGHVNFNLQVPNNQATLLTGAYLLETGNQNFLVNPSFETGTAQTSWTVNGNSAYATESTIITNGKNSLKIVTGGGAAQSEVKQAVTPSQNLVGTIEASCDIKSNLTAELPQLCAQQAGSDYVCTTISNDNNWHTVTAMMAAPSSGSIGINIKDTANPAGATMYVDNCYIGPARNVSLFNNVTAPVAYTPTFTGFGTPTNVNFVSWRVGAFLYVQGFFTAGSNTGVEARITLGYNGTSANVTTVSTYPSSGQLVGTANAATSATTDFSGRTILAEPSKTYMNVGAEKSTVNGTAAANATVVGVDASTFTLNGVFQIAGWGTDFAYKPDVFPASWSGYHDNTCSWARTNAAYGDPTADATCTLVERQNRNFGTVSTYNSAGSALPGIVFSPPQPGRYFVCATPKLTGSGLAAFLDIQLWDGTTVIATAQNQQAVASDIEQETICGIYNAASTASVTLSLQSKASAGSVTIAANNTNVSAVEWSIVDLDQSFPSPFLAGSVTSSNSASNHLESNRVTCGNSASATTTGGTGNGWLTVANGASAGLCTITFTTGEFSIEPTCNCTVVGAATTSATHCIFTATPSTTTLLVSRQRAGAAENGDIQLTCSGQK